MEGVSTLILEKLKSMIEATNPDPIYSMRKVLTVLFPYIAQQKQHKMLDVFLCVVRASGQSGFMWHWIRLPFITLLNEGSPVSLKQAAILASPYLPWWSFPNDEHLIQLWAAAASRVPYTDKVGQSVIDTLLQIASNGSLRPHIPVDMWSWLNNRPNLPPTCIGRLQGSIQVVVQAVRALGNMETLKSYLLLVWSEWDPIHLGGVRNYSGQHCSYQKSLPEMCTSIREDFKGNRMEKHREDLLQWLDHILGQLELGLSHLQKQKPNLNGESIKQMMKQYEELESVLLEVGGKQLTADTRRIRRREEREKRGKGRGEEKGNVGPNQPMLKGMGHVSATT